MAKTQKTYEVRLRVPGDKMATIMALLADEVTLLSMNEVASSTPEPQRKTGYANGKKDKGISGERLLLRELRAMPMRRDGIAKAFELAGFAAATGDPATSNAIKLGYATRDETGLVKITEAGRVHYDKGES